MKRTLTQLLLVLPVFGAAQHFSNSISLNQLGFYPSSPKRAVITSAVETSDFYLTSTNLRDTFFRGQLSSTLISRHSSLKTRIADFTAFSREGSYVLLVNGLGHSSAFRIDQGILHDVGTACLQAFYYQRASMPLQVEFAGKWHRSEGHPDTEVLVHPSAATVSRPAGTVISSPGGWYDAGDYNKYIVNSGITMQTLLMAYAHFPEYFTSRMSNIPESVNGIPDILDETIYNLRWMLTMQDPNDGGVYHKCTNAAFGPMVMPGIYNEPRYVLKKSTAAALDFCAVMAKAAGILADSGKWPGLADTCRKAAQKAWDWALLHPGIIYNQEEINKMFKPGISTGTYGDGDISDEWVWASAEMFRLTSDVQYLLRMKKHMGNPAKLPAWNNVNLLGYYALLDFKGSIPSEYRGLWEEMRRNLLALADTLVQYQAVSAFQVPMGCKDGDFEWGSNSNAANQGILLLYAYRLTGNNVYLEAALANADYLLGRNATGYCFVTGFGAKSPKRPHHRQSVADGVEDPVPGFLVGGPNPFRQDQCNYAQVERETAFTDDDCSYASNEIAINWNAPAVYLFNALHALLAKRP